jgi:two-component system nitrate/nitrite response regulator NarL
MLNQIDTLLFDSNALFREGLVRILEGTRFVVTSEVKAPQLHDALALADHPPQLVIADLGDSSDRDLGTVVTLRKAFPSSKIVVLAGSDSPELFAKALRAGVDGYLLKDISVDTFTRCLQIVAMGLQIFPTSVRLMVDPGLQNWIEPRSSNGDAAVALSEREGQILRCLVDGYSNKTIARELDIAEATVKVYVKGLLRKIHARNRTQAAVWAVSRQTPTLVDGHRSTSVSDVRISSADRPIERAGPDGDLAAVARLRRSR